MFSKEMRKFIFGLATGIAATLFLGAAILLMLSEQIEREVSGIFGNWEERKGPNLELTLYPSGEVELSDTFGMGASELAEFLGQGNEEKRNNYLSALKSGIPTKIVFAYMGEGPMKTQQVLFRNGNVEEHFLEIGADINITWEDSSMTELVESDIDFLNSEKLLRAVEARLNRSVSSEPDVAVTGVTTETEPDKRMQFDGSSFHESKNQDEF